ncbi:hypothetical protein G6F56_008019 [Rhizopus delemar]|uniref:BZIP domain-containing protein n=1 Tax=Rhizopus stolonifer TaxID=4846 RepID=A0A367IKV7_RHIST|nr:hypothetical protein G6F56_008019 [Rhizopus delemar]RCH78161.1 hypothetical protein CU098_001609 [Rhizopus stolonifer]
MSISNIDSFSFDINDKSLDILNSAIQSHYDESNLSYNLIPSVKREHENDVKTVKSTKKAGRKPLPDKPEKNKPLDPKQKRKAQNRAAQRAFRDRKEKHVSELQERIAELEEQMATQDETLLKENRELKEMLKKLQQENYALKGNQFTFQFPLSKEDQASSSSSGTEDGSEQTSPSNATPTEPILFGLEGDNLFSQTFGNELIHGKDDLFPHYSSTTALDDFLFPQIDLSDLFGGGDNLFGMDMAQQFGLPKVPTMLDKKKKWFEGLKKAKEQGKNLYEYHQEIIKEIPDFDLDTLCENLKQKAQCSVSNYVVTDNDINKISNCIDHATAAAQIF